MRPEGIYPHRFRTRLLIEGEGDFQALKPRLEVPGQGAEATGCIRLSAADYKSIISQFTAQAPVLTANEKHSADDEPPVRQEGISRGEVVSMLEKMGTLLGREVESGCKQTSGYDVVWKECGQPRTVIEVCEPGDLDEALSALNQASDKLKATALLVTLNRADFDQAKMRVPPSSGIVTVEAKVVKRLLEMVESEPEFMRTVFKGY
jgi:hypothetical protein